MTKVKYIYEERKETFIIQLIKCADGRVYIFDYKPVYWRQIKAAKAHETTHRFESDEWIAYVDAEHEDRKVTLAIFEMIRKAMRSGNIDTYRLD